MNISITDNETKEIAKLAQLELTAQDLSNYQKNIAKVFELIDQLHSINTENLEPMSHPQNIMQRLRSDTVAETNQREILQKSAPQIKDYLYLVPKAIEEDN